MKKRLIILLLCLLVCFSTNLITTSALDITSNKHSPQLVNDCVSRGTCMKVCEYEHYYEISKYNKDKKYSSVYVYYYLNDKQFLFEWFGPANKTGDKKYSKKNTFKSIFIQDDVKKLLLKNGKCPTNAYVDADEFNGPNELCFDNNGKYCKSDPGKSFTSFKGTSTIKFNYADAINLYFSNYAPNISCNQLINKDFNIYDTIVLDFRNNYLKGNQIPKFIEDNEEFINGYDSLSKKFSSVKEKCDNEIKDKLENGQVSSSEAEDLLNKNDEGLKDALDELELSKEELKKDESEELGDLEQGELQKGCDVIPPVIRKWINNILNFVKYVALALVIALGALDFMKAAGSGEPDAMKKAGQTFMKRMIAVVILFLVPVLVDFILNMINIYGVDTSNIDCL